MPMNTYWRKFTPTLTIIDENVLFLVTYVISPVDVKKSGHILMISELINRTANHTPHHEFTMNKQDVVIALTNVNVESYVAHVVLVVIY